MVTVVLSGIFCGTNQAFFMAFFFLLAGYFTAPSLEKKGTGKFLKDRLIRLGIPVLIYDIFINPAIIYAILKVVRDTSYFYSDYFIYYLKTFSRIGTGPLWFLSALFVFSFVYSGEILLFPIVKGTMQSDRPFPKTLTIIIFSAICGLAAFGIRLWIPDGDAIKALNYQIGYFV